MPTGIPRQDLADLLTAALAGKDVTVYDHPADLVSVPAVVVDYDDPAIAPMFFGPTLGWKFQVWVLVPRADVKTAVEQWELLFADVAGAIAASAAQSAATVGAAYKWVQMSKPSTQEINDVQAFGSSLEVEARL